MFFRKMMEQAPIRPNFAMMSDFAKVSPYSITMKRDSSMKPAASQSCSFKSDISHRQSGIPSVVPPLSNDNLKKGYFQQSTTERSSSRSNPHSRYQSSRGNPYSPYPSSRGNPYSSYPSSRDSRPYCHASNQPSSQKYRPYSRARDSSSSDACYSGFKAVPHDDAELSPDPTILLFATGRR